MQKEKGPEMLDSAYLNIAINMDPIDAPSEKSSEDLLRVQGPAKKKPLMVSGLMKVSLPQCTTSKIPVTRMTWPKRRAKPKKRTM